MAAPSYRNLSEPLAVMVWIYGGSFQFGDGIEFGLYDPTQLVSKHNVVVVSFNYRLGPLVSQPHTTAGTDSWMLSGLC